MIGFFTVGIFCDLLLKGKYIYTCIVILHAFVFTLIVVNMISVIVVGNQTDSLFKKYIKVFAMVYGYFSSVGWILIFAVLPLYVTAKQREKHSFFEIPMAAQIFSVLNASQILLAMLLSSIFYLLPKNIIFGQILPSILLIVSLLPLKPLI